MQNNNTNRFVPGLSCRQSAYQSQCPSNLHQWSVADAMYAGDHVEWIKFANDYSTISPAFTISGSGGPNTWFLYPDKYGKGP